jgi:copper chaperone CopZ
MKFIQSSLLLGLLAAPAILYANGEKNKTETVVIQTSAMCGSCETRIETAVKELKGVKSADLDLADKKITVMYSPKKINGEQIKAAIAATGYDADEVTCNPESYSKLPGCCKKDGGH